MKALTLTAPYGTLIALGRKRIETRSWSTTYRGTLAIHQAKGPGDFGDFSEIRKLCGTQPFFDNLMTIVPNFDDYCDRDLIFEALPRGKVVAVCELVDVVKTNSSFPNLQVEPWFTGRRGSEVWDVPPAKETDERAFGDYSPGRYAWLLADVRALPEPIPARGALSLWDWDAPAGI